MTLAGYLHMARLALAALFTLQPMLAQAAGEIRLSVTDSSGAALPAARGFIENLATGSKRSFQTDGQGSSALADLPFGRYRLQIAKDGFASHSASIDVQNATPVKRDIVLAVGVSSFAVTVAATTPLPGADRDVNEIAAPVQLASQGDIVNSGALDLSDFLNRRINGVYLNEIQGNPLQPDLNYRGYTASPLLGTPQGISIYLDGVRLNQPFGDIVSWDLIPRIAISEVALIPGSNPLFGLNTLGGALSMRTKDGSSQPGATLQLSGGSFGRKVADFEYGGSHKAFDWYTASNLFFEDGWRESSPSSVRQFFGKLGWRGDRTFLGLSLAYANNSLIGNGLQELTFLNRDYRSVYTKPDATNNRSPFLNLQARHAFTPRVNFSGNAYFRYIRTRTLNGDINEDSLDQSVYQPGAAERAALAAAGYSGFPTAGATAANTPFPFWRCIGNALIRDEPGEKCNGLLNRGSTHQRNYGLAGQVTWTNGGNQFTAGAAYDGNRVGFSQSTELGYLNPDRSVTGVGAFGDGVTGGNVDGEPYDTRVNLSGRIHSGSFFATDTYGGKGWNATVSGRFNRTTIDNRDRIRPQAGTGSLTGQHSFARFNPAVGVTFHGLYAGYTEGNRAPTSIELGCADPESPCKLPNAMAGDPPLKQVVTRTVEAGYRGGSSDTKLRWSAGFFRADNRNDILFVASEQTGYGYFKNFGKTLRQGVETDASARLGRVTLGGGYTFLQATFESGEEVNGTGNSSNEDALRGLRGFESAIEIQPGNRMPLTPKHMLKAYADLQLTSKFQVDLGAFGVSSSYARGNENNRHKPDGVYYLGPGTSPGYVVANAGARYQIHRRIQFFVQVNNLFNRRYYSGAQLGPTGFTDTGNFIARPFPAVNGEFPVRQSTFFAPGAPRGAWAGIRVRF
jgi:outer membrane receptor protein involved in Fe transport